jgi:serine/threonine-protein kinase
MVLGTPAYMAPEQLAGAPACPAGDLYSLGVVLFELLTSRRPVEAGSLGEWLRRISQEPATPLLSLRPDLPAVMGEVVDQMLERAPARRPPLAEDVALALERCQQALVTHC